MADTGLPCRTYESGAARSSLGHLPLSAFHPENRRSWALVWVVAGGLRLVGGEIVST